MNVENEEFFWNDGLRIIKNIKNSWNALDGYEKKFLTIKNNCEDGMKLEPRIFKRTEKDLRELSYGLQI